jgi:hypothetical protein
MVPLYPLDLLTLTLIVRWRCVIFLPSKVYAEQVRKPTVNATDPFIAEHHLGGEMKKSKRILMLGVFIEAFLASVAVFLIVQTKSGALGVVVSQEETIGRIGSAIGAAIGALGVFFILFWLHLRKQGE